MSILVLSADDEASDALRAALTRLNLEVQCVLSIDAASVQARTRPPLVVVVDTALAGHEAFCDQLLQVTPWVRLSFMADPGFDHPSTLAPVHPKPFDAAEVAQLLVQQTRAAELDKSRHALHAEAQRLTRHQRGLERELEHSERLAALGRIAAGMAHEINNPLAVIHASVEYVSEVARRVDDSELMQCVEDMALAVERIGSFVQHVCSFSRRERPQLTEATLSDATSIAQRMVAPRAKQKGVTVQADAVPNVRVPHDPPRLAQALLNLLSNAIDATMGHGSVVQLRVEERPTGLSVIIEDEGPGIGLVEQEMLFRPFSTTKAPGEGTGLGLTITRSILSDHGGSVRLENRPQGGARAECFIPCFAAAEHRVAIVEADPAVRRALRGDLVREGFGVYSAGTLEELQEASVGEEFSVVIFDLGPANESAPALVRAVADAAPQAKRLVVSGNPGAHEPNVDATLPKPWERIALLETVRQLCLARRATSATAADDVEAALSGLAVSVDAPSAG